MNKRELIETVAADADLDHLAAGAAVNATLEAITRALGGGDKVTLAGFGTFEVRARPARTGRNPQTGEPMEIAASTTPAFKAAPGLKAAIRTP